jgi:hypothetical protein
VAGKETTLSIVLRTVDRATAGINAVNKRIDAATKPIRDFRKAIGELREKSGLDEISAGFSGVGSAITGILGKVAMIGGAVGVAVAGVLSLVAGFDDLGDKAEAAGVSVDFLSGVRYAAERSGLSVEKLDAGMQSLSLNMGQLRAGTGKFKTFVDTLPPAMGRQLRATKTNEEAFDLLANAMVKIQDPAKRALFAQKAFGDAAAAPLLAKGAAGIKELRDRYAALAGPQGAAAGKAGAVDDAMKDLKASTDGVKAALVEGLGPALEKIILKLGTWLTENREKIGAWAKELGEKLPAAFDSLVDGVKGAIGFLTPFFNSTTKIKIAIGALIAVMVGPLISAIVSLGIALAANPIGLILTAIAALAVAWFIVITRWDEVKAYFGKFWKWLGDKIGPFRDIIAGVMAPFIYIPAQIIANWGPIKKFFIDVWDGISGAFQRAWKIIEGIGNKITGVVSTIRDGIGGALDVIGLGDDGPAMVDYVPGSGGVLDIMKRATNALPTSRSTEARVTVDFTNAPRGTRVNTDPQSTASVDTSVGHQMTPGF